MRYFLGDVWSGTKLRDTTVEERGNTLYLAICCDATEFQKDSWTPVIVKILNLHPEIRINKDAMITLAVLPGKIQKRGTRDMGRVDVDSVKHFYKMMDFVLLKNEHMFADTGFEVYDAHLGQLRRIYLKIVITIEDGKGCPRVVGCKSDNAYNGACPFCNITG